MFEDHYIFIEDYFILTLLNYTEDCLFIYCIGICLHLFQVEVQIRLFTVLAVPQLKKKR